MEPKPVAVPDATPPARAVLLAWASVPSVTPSWALSSSSGLVPACPSGSSPGSHLTTSARDRRLCPRTPGAGPCRLGLVSEARPAPACGRSCTNASEQLNPENEVTSAGGGGGLAGSSDSRQNERALRSRAPKLPVPLEPRPRLGSPAPSLPLGPELRLSSFPFPLRLLRLSQIRPISIQFHCIGFVPFNAISCLQSR